MAEAESGSVRNGSVLRQRLRRASPPQIAPAGTPVPPPTTPSLQRLAAHAAARALRRAGGLAATAEAVTSQGISLSELPELLPERALIAVIEAGDDRLGVAALCPTLLASLIEVQAIGHITARAVAPRRPTRADAALAAEFVNLLMGELAEALAGQPGHAALAGYRYASYLDDPRPLELMLDDIGFRTLCIDLRLGAGGERRGSLMVSVPATPTGEAPVADGAAVRASTPARHVPPAEGQRAAPVDLAEAARSAPVPLAAVLCRRRISLRELRALKPGTSIALPRGAVDDVWLETGRGQKLARGKLGEIDGYHALRLRRPEAAARPSSADDMARPAHVGPDGGHATLPAAPVNPFAELALPTIAEPPIADLEAPDAFRGVEAFDGTLPAFREALA